MIFDGVKNFNTGGVVSDLTVLEGVYAGTEHHIFAFVPTVQPGIQFAVSLLLHPFSIYSHSHSTTGTTLASASPNPAVSKFNKSKFKKLDSKNQSHFRAESFYITTKQHG